MTSSRPRLKMTTTPPLFDAPHVAWTLLTHGT